MSSQSSQSSQTVIIGLTAEGKTDVRFFNNLIQRTFAEAAEAYEQQSIHILSVVRLFLEPGKKFNEQIEDCTKEAVRQGITILCVHADADHEDDQKAFTNKLNPAFRQIQEAREKEGPVYPHLVAIVPVWMTEAWLLADKELLKKQIGTEKSDKELGIEKNPEKIAKPKEVIQEAIRIAGQDIRKRHRHKLDISNLYEIIGLKVDLEHLRRLDSFRKFEEASKVALRSFLERS